MSEAKDRMMEEVRQLLAAGDREGAARVASLFAQAQRSAPGNVTRGALQTPQMLWGMYQALPLSERAAVEKCRSDLLEYFKLQRAGLAALPTTTSDDLEMIDTCIRFMQRKLGWLPEEEKTARDERRRMKTRERVRRHRARKA